MEQIAQRSCGFSILEVFKARSGRAWIKLVWWRVSLPIAGGMKEIQSEERRKNNIPVRIINHWSGKFKYLVDP